MSAGFHPHALSARFSLLALSLAAAGCTGPQSALDPAGPAAAAIARTWWLMFWGASAVLALVMALVLFAMLRRPRPQPMRRPERFIVLGGLALPTVTLFALLVHGSLLGRTVIGHGIESDLVIQVIGRQWQWQFDHLDADGRVLASSLDELILPAGPMIEFRIDSEDVIHSFWIPRLGGKIDAIPGRSNRLRLRADAPATMRGQCAEFCGLEHAHMHFSVEVVDLAAYESWLSEQSASMLEPAP